MNSDSEIEKVCEEKIKREREPERNWDGKKRKSVQELRQHWTRMKNK